MPSTVSQVLTGVLLTMRAPDLLCPREEVALYHSCLLCLSSPDKYTTHKACIWYSVYMQCLKVLERELSIQKAVIVCSRRHYIVSMDMWHLQLCMPCQGCNLAFSMHMYMAFSTCQRPHWRPQQLKSSSVVVCNDARELLAAASPLNF